MNETEEREIPWLTMAGMLGGRLVTISGFLIFLSFVLAQDGIAFFAFIAFAYIITIPYSLWMRNQDRMRQLAPLQFLVDLVFVSGLVYFTGGRGLDFLILLYPLIILSAGIILPLRQTIQITILSIISYTLVTLLMSQDILIAYPAYGVSDALVETSSAMVLRLSIFVFFGIASAYVSRRCDYINQKEKQFRKITQIIFQNVKAGLLLLDATDKIIMANDRACILLGRDEPELTGKDLSSIHLKPSEIKELERIRAAANMAKEMAHQIRSPLTGISGAVQLLQFNFKKPPTEKGSAQEQENLCDQIVQESARMENVIQNFLDYAEFSPRDIRDLIQMDIDREIGEKKQD